MNKDFIVPNEWSIIVDHFDKADVTASESIFSLGNGSMGQRANYEEKYSGDSLQGSYIGGIYSQIKHVWAGGKMVIQNILPKF